jgi:hypothetical protein
MARATLPKEVTCQPLRTTIQQPYQNMISLKKSIRDIVHLWSKYLVMLMEMAFSLLFQNDSSVTA